MSFLDDLEKLKHTSKVPKKKISKKEHIGKKKGKIVSHKKKEDSPLKFVETEEYKQLKDSILESNYSVIHIYGFFQVGKTTSVLNIVNNNPYLYFYVRKKDEFDSFLNFIFNLYPDLRLLDPQKVLFFKTLEKKIQYLIIDNVDKFDALSSEIFNEFFIQLLSNTYIKIIFIHSLSTNQLNLEQIFPQSSFTQIKFQLMPIKIDELSLFHPTISQEEALIVFALFGGIPKYLNQISVPIWDFLHSNLFLKAPLWKMEVEYFLLQYFKNLNIYIEILACIAQNKKTLKEIRLQLGMKSSDLSQYIQNLMQFSIIKRELPLLAKKNSRNGLYFIQIPFLRFYFGFIFPNFSNIAMQKFSINSLHQNLSLLIIDVISEQVLIYLPKMALNWFNFDKIGSWWIKSRFYPIVAWNTKNQELLIGKCLWHDNRPIPIILSEITASVSYILDFLNPKGCSFLLIDFHNHEIKSSFKGYKIFSLTYEQIFF
ncbi:ATP-binding protein [Candidatus Harpocratesius sp.]